MYPIIRIFGREIATYAIMALVGYLSAGTFACVAAHRRGLGYHNMTVMLLWAAVGAVAGGSILYALTNLGSFDIIWGLVYETTSSRGFFAYVVFVFYLFGGSVFYGGFIGGCISSIIYLRASKIAVGEYADIAAPTVPLFHAFARVGCFMGGCCYGIESDYGFTYTHSLVEAANGVRRFPVQLAESLFDVALFLLLWKLLSLKNLSLKKGSLKGKLFPIYILMYSTGRFFLEFLRGDEIRGIFGGISTSQYISAALFCFAVFMLLRQSVNQAA